jgi:PPOX class probable F420-dependent enzyme
VEEAVMRRRVVEARVGRLGTVGADGRPHVVPCCFAVDGEVVYTAVDDVKAKRTRHLRRLDNVRRHPDVCLLVDEYREEWSRLWWVRLDGRAHVAESTSPEHAVGVRLLAGKYEQYRSAPPPGPAIVIDVVRWRAWP